MKRDRFPWIAVVATVFLFAVIFSHILAGAPEKRAAQSKTTATSPRAAERNGEIVVHLNPKTQSHLGIREARLKPARERKQRSLPAMVLPVDKLAALVSAYDAAGARLQKAEITAKVSRQEYDRLKKLYRDQQNVSQKAVQTGAGVYRNAQVDVQLARTNLSLAAAAVLQNWGEAITGWLGHDAARLQRVLLRQDVLVEMTLPMGETFVAPSGIEFSLPAGGRAYARFISAFPQVDPRVQGVGYLYVTKARPGLAPGINLIAHFGVGALRRGVVVPSSAVVWLHGEAWAYVATGPETFVRREVPTDVPVSGGWFVAHGFAPRASVVTRDAQQVLGVELTPSSAGLGDD